MQPKCVASGVGIGAQFNLLFLTLVKVYVVNMYFGLELEILRNISSSLTFEEPREGSGLWEN